MRKEHFVLISSIQACLIFFSLEVANALIIHVPEDYPTIQQGIDAVNNGDTVLVAPGEYTENPVVNHKNILLSSSAGPENTTIWGYVAFGGADIDTTCILRGFTIHRPSDLPHDLLEIVDASPNIQGNIIAGTYGEYYTGVTIFNSRCMLRSNIIRDNLSYGFGHGVDARGGFVTIEGNIIKGNGAQGAGWSVFGLGLAFQAGIVRHNLVVGNRSICAMSTWGAGFFAGVGPYQITNNTIVGNVIFGAMYGEEGSGAFIFSVLPDGMERVIKNNIIANNLHPVGVRGSINDSNWTGWDYNLVFGNDTIDYFGLVPGPHDIQADPMFVDTASGNYHLLPGSPCIDAGDPTFPLDPDSTLADIGAYYFDQAVGIDEPGPTGPYQFALKQNYPNPFNAQTVISYTLDRKTTVSLLIYSITGQRVKSLAIEEPQEPGEHRYMWDGTDRNGRAVSTGIYFYELYVDVPAKTTAGKYKESKAMILIK